jgi:hypothetical protein
MTFQVGDRVRLDRGKLLDYEDSHGRRSAWADFDGGTLIHRKDKYSTGYGSEIPGSTGVTWGVRWDGHDYGDSPSNCHTADEILLLLDTPREDELDEVLKSIGQAVQRTRRR